MTRHVKTCCNCFKNFVYKYIMSTTFTSDFYCNLTSRKLQETFITILDTTIVYYLQNIDTKYNFISHIVSHFLII